MDKRPNSLNIALSSEEKKKIIDDIIYYFETERDEKIGIIASENIFDFFMDSLGKHIYNKALDDTKLWYERRMEDIEADYYALYKQIP
jgi:uncharacterized protein (DUF2164 family)